MFAQIVLPILVVALLALAGIVVAWRAAFQADGDVGRWAAISTMWLLLPIMTGGLLVLAVSGALIFLLGKVSSWIPQRSARAQRFAARIESGTRRAAEMVRRPVLAVRGVGSLLRSRWQRIRERI